MSSQAMAAAGDIAADLGAARKAVRDMKTKHTAMKAAFLQKQREEMREARLKVKQLQMQEKGADKDHKKAVAAQKMKSAEDLLNEEGCAMKALDRELQECCELPCLQKLLDCCCGSTLQPPWRRSRSCESKADLDIF